MHKQQADTRAPPSSIPAPGTADGAADGQAGGPTSFPPCRVQDAAAFRGNSL